MNDTYQKWEHFRVIKKFTILPLRIYQYTSQRTWWSWLKTSYILQDWHYASEGLLYYSDNLIKWFKSYFFGGYWGNSRMSDVDEYNDYLNYKKQHKI